MASNMTQRVLFAVVAIPAVLALVWYGGAPLAVLVSVVAALGTRELLQFARQRGVRPLALPAMVAAILFPALAWAVTVSPDTRRTIQDWWPFLAAIWIILLLTGTLWRRTPDQKPLGAVTVTLFAPLYAGALPAFLIAIRHSTQGTRSLPGLALVMFPLVTVWICDSVAMTVGRRVGGAKLAPVVSPGKTWSGTVGGFVGALVVAPLYTQLVFRSLAVPVSPWQALVIAAMLGVMGQAGDLAESLLKREAGLKDSSHLIPGHGGVLDRLDSLYFAIPLTAALYRLFGVI